VNRAWGRFVRGLRGALAALVFGSVFVTGASAQPADTVDAAIPAIDISLDRREIGEGRFRVDFGVPEDVVLGNDDFYIRVHSIEEPETWSFATLDASVSFASQIPGKRAVQGQLCRSAAEARDQCGPLSKAVSVRIPNSVAVDVPAPAQGGGVGVSSVGGPSFTTPGSFVSTKTKWNAWQLMWLNSLAQQQAPDAQPQPFFELIVRWLTYEYDANLGRYVPIWLWAQLKRSGTSSTWVGALYYRTFVNGAQRDTVIGSVQITPNAVNPKNVSVWWRSTRGGMYATQATGSWVNDTLNFADALAPGTNPPPHDHMMGDWTPVLAGGTIDRASSIVTWIERNQESLQFVFFDNAGRPVWARADWRDAATAPPTTGREEFCAFTVFDAIAPDTTPAAGHPLTLEWLGNCDGSSGANVARSYDPVGPGRDRSGRVWADLTLPAYRPGRLVLGSSFSMREMIKLSHFHDIRPVIDGVDGKTTCTVDAGQNCTLNLRWVLEGIYPNAAVYRKALPGGSPVRIFSSIPGSEPGRAYTLPGPGRYEFQIRRTGSSSSDLLARSHPVEVISTAAETPPTPISNPNFTADTATNTTGATRGEFRIDESGAATYRIPIMTAPSGGGMAPEIALVYNSQSGNGIAGLGWQIDGVSSISRCAKTYETDGENGGITLGPNDRFCLDGQKLIVVTGSYGAHGAEYRLEVDQVVRVRSFGNQAGAPEFFQVWRKDGTVSWYGATERNGVDNGSARVLSKTSTTPNRVWSWNIGRVEDSAGNFARFIWSDVGGASPVETVLSRVEYGGHAGDPELVPNNQIIFGWATRPDADRKLGFSAGVRLTSSRRLNWILSRSEGQDLRKYELDYTPASATPYRPGRLREVKECNGTNCFQPTTFDWHHVEPELGEAQINDKPDLVIPTPNIVKQLQTADLNGDGMEDLLYLERQASSSNPPRIKYFLAQRQANGGARLVGSPIDGGSLHATVKSNDLLPEIQLLDADGDGTNELVYAVFNNGSSEREVFAHFWNGTGYSAATRVGVFSRGTGRNLQALDWDGDGLTDLLYMNSQGSVSASVGVLRNVSHAQGTPAEVLFAEDNTFTIDLQQQHVSHEPNDLIQFFVQRGRVFDSNGDGRADVVLRVDFTDCPPDQLCQPIVVADPDPVDEPAEGSGGYEGNGNGGDSGDNDAGPADPEPPSGDETATAQTVSSRYVLFEMTEDGAGQPVFRSRWVLGRTQADTSQSGANSIISLLQVVDLNNDGLADFLYFDNSQGRWRFQLNDGENGFESRENLFSLDGWPSGFAIRSQLRMADVNGDGHLDALFPSSAASSSANWQVAYWRGSLNGGVGGFEAGLTPTDAPAGRIDLGANSLFVDFNKDGKTDQLVLIRDGDTRFKGFVARGRDRLTGQIGYQPTRMIRRITDGFGAWTEFTSVRQNLQ